MCFNFYYRINGIINNWFLILFNSYFEAQDDDQDIAGIACASSTSSYEFNSDDGYIETKNYPGLYPNNEDCQWFINPTNGIPDGQVSCIMVPKKQNYHTEIITNTSN